MSKKRLLYAQVQALRWLQGRISDQFVKAYIQTEIESLERIGYPIKSNGTELDFPKAERNEKQLPGQMDIEVEANKISKRVVVVCEKLSDIREKLALSPNNPYLLIVTENNFEKAYGLTNVPFIMLRSLNWAEESYAKQHDWKLIDKHKLFEILDMFA